MHTVLIVNELYKKSKKMLETTECIPISNKGRNYTDCMEFSLLRFLHLLVFDEKEINSNNYSTWYYDSDKVHDDIKKFIEKYPFIFRDGSLYDSDEEGKQEREEWSTLVSDRDFFEYYRNDSAELFTNVKNILLMFKNFFKIDLKMEESEYDNDLDVIAKKFTTKDKQIKLEIISKEHKVQKANMKMINAYLSKDDKQYKEKINEKDIYKVNIKKTIIGISINESYYEWNLMEYVLDSSHTDIDNKFITGHSVIYKIN